MLMPLSSSLKPYAWAALALPERSMSFEGIMSRKVSKKVMETIADRLATGESLLMICRDEAMPSYRTVTRAVVQNDELYEIYRRGRLLQAEFYSDHINDLARQPLPDTIDPKFLNAEVQRRRLEVDTLKFTMGKLQPWGLRDKKDDAPQNNSVTLTWMGSEVQVEA